MTDLAQVLGVGVAPGNAQLVVTWTAVDTATGYTVQWMSGSQGYNTGDRQATVTSGSTTRYTIPSLTNGTEYTVRVIATRTGVTDGPPSAEVTGTPRVPPPPPPPTAVTDLARHHARRCAAAPAVDVGQPGLQRRRPAGHGDVGVDHALHGLINGTEYTVRVSATRTGVTDGPPSAEMTGTPRVPPPPPPPPPPVTDLARCDAPGNAIWTAVDTATVQWMSGSQGYNAGDRQATVTSGSTTRYTIPSLINGGIHGRVSATRTGVTDVPALGGDDGDAEVTTRDPPVTTPGAPQACGRSLATRR